MYTCTYLCSSGWKQKAQGPLQRGARWAKQTQHTQETSESTLCFRFFWGETVASEALQNKRQSGINNRCKKI